MSTSTTQTVLGRLDADWAATATTSRARRALRNWKHDPTQGHLFAGVHDIDDVIARLHRCSGIESDPLLAALIDLAQHGDEIAARVVLQAFMPLAVNLAGRTRRGDWEYQSDVISLLAEMIATFPLVTHPHHVAGHLAFMVRRGLNRRHRRRYVATVSLDDDGVAAVVDAHRRADSLDSRTAADRVAEIVSTCHHSGALDDSQARLLMFVAAGHKVAELARQAGCHRSRMGARVAKATAATAEFAVAA